MMLEGFDAAVSLDYEEQDELYFMLPHRMWGEITLGRPDNIVLAFSHDTRKANAPFKSPYQWLEEHVPVGSLCDEEFSAFEAEWHDPNKWHVFFRQRIEREISRLETEASVKQSESEALVEEAAILSRALGQKSLI